MSLNQASVSCFQERQTLFVGLACALLVANGIAKMDTSIAERRANHGERAALANDVELHERAGRINSRSVTTSERARDPFQRDTAAKQRNNLFFFFPGSFPVPTVTVFSCSLSLAGCLIGFLPMVPTLMMNLSLSSWESMLSRRCDCVMFSRL